MSGTHSILAPSGMSITMQCAAAPRMQAPYANAPPTEESLEGDAAHWLAHAVAAWYIAGNPDAQLPGKGDKAPNGVEIDQSMIDGAELWASAIGAAPECGVILESPVSMPGVHPHMYGTPDGRKREPRVSRWYDYKYGHRYVEVFECWQLVGYAASELEKPRDEWPDFFEFVIVQPRSYCPEGPVRRWACSTDHLVALVNRMHAQAARAVDESGVPRADAPAATGHECGDCKARHACTLFQSVAARIVDESARADLFELKPKELGAELTYLTACIDRLKARKSGLEIQAEALLGKGERIPGWGMESTAGNLTWLDNVDVDEIAGFGSTLNVELRRAPELVTPTQGKAILKRRGLDPELLDAYSSRPRGKMKLVQSTILEARKAFGANSK